MNKPILPPTFRNIRPPNNNYTYFEDNQHHPFLPLANSFELVNAGWLADMAMLAYGSESFIQQKLDDSHPAASVFFMEFFNRDTTQAVVCDNQDRGLVLNSTCKNKTA